MSACCSYRRGSGPASLHHAAQDRLRPRDHSIDVEFVNNASAPPLAQEGAITAERTSNCPRERFRVAWVDTDTGGRIHFTAAFRWAEVTETSLYRRLGLLRGELADFPRRHVEAEYFRVLVFEDEVEVRL